MHLLYLLSGWQEAGAGEWDDRIDQLELAQGTNDFRNYPVTVVSTVTKSDS